MKIALLCSDSGSGGLIKYVNSFLETPTSHEVNLYCGLNLGIKDSQYVNIIRTPFANESGMDLILNRTVSATKCKNLPFICGGGSKEFFSAYFSMRRSKNIPPANS